MYWALVAVQQCASSRAPELLTEHGAFPLTDATPADVPAAATKNTTPTPDRPASIVDSERKNMHGDEVAGVTAAGLTGPSGKKWLAAGEDEPQVCRSTNTCLQFNGNCTMPALAGSRSSPSHFDPTTYADALHIHEAEVDG